MSVEPILLSAIVESGNVKQVLREGVTVEDFADYAEEFDWLIFQTQQNRDISTRRFLSKFPDFSIMDTGESIKELCLDLKRERAFAEIQDIMKEMSEELEPDNAFDTAQRFRDALAAVSQYETAHLDIHLSRDWKSHYQHIRHLRDLRGQGINPGLPTGLPHFDYHLDGLQPATMGTFLARPGEGKSFLIAYISAHARVKAHARVGLFSPEMNEHEHRCRIDTIYSAFKEIQEAVGLKNTFRNRALKRGDGFNLKAYHAFLEYMEQYPGEIILFNQRYRKGKITPSYIESQIDEEGLDLVIVDPIYKLKSPRRRESPYLETADCVDLVEEICKTQNIPVIITNQAHRQNSSKSRAPSKDNSFGTDTPIHESDFVVSVKHFSEDRELELRCDKNRHGEAFTVYCRFFPNIGVIQEKTSIRSDYLNGNHAEDAEDVVAAYVSGEIDAVEMEEKVGVAMGIKKERKGRKSDAAKAAGSQTPVRKPARKRVPAGSSSDSEGK